MTTNRMPSLTPAEIRKIGNQAVADVANKKITTSKSGSLLSTKASQASRNAQSLMVTRDSQKSSTIQKELAGSVLSQAQGRGYFTDAFNKARKG